MSAGGRPPDAAHAVTRHARPSGVAESCERPGLCWLSARSAVLGEDVACWARTPPGAGPFPVLYLLHGRGRGYADAIRLLDRVRAAEESGVIGPRVVVGVDAPWSERAGWYTDSRHVRGRPVSRALLDEVLPALEAVLPVRRDRRHRTVGGWSMGGAGALRFALLRPDAFGAVLALSPAVYRDLPPARSTTRAHGAFGDGEVLFSPERWHADGYPRLLARCDGVPRLRVALATGDAEVPGREETSRLLCALRAAGAVAACRELPGGHDWRVWDPAFDWAARWLWSIAGNTDK